MNTSSGWSNTFAAVQYCRCRIDHVGPLVLPGERRGEIQAVRVPLVRFHLQRIVSALAVGHAERRDIAELRERPQALRHRIRAGVAGVRQLVEATRRGCGRIKTRRQQRAVGGVVEVEAERSQPLVADRVQVDQVVGGEPFAPLPTYATSTTRSRVISRCSEMLHWLSLGILPASG